MTILYDDTALLLAIDAPQDTSSRDAALTSLSATVVTCLSLEAKAKSYHHRVDRTLAAAANRGATIDELAAAAGLSQDEVLRRLRAVQPGLVDARIRSVLGLDARPSEPAPVATRPSAPLSPIDREPEPAPVGIVVAEAAAQDARPRRTRRWWRG